MSNYGESLKYQREISGLSQLELAKQISTSHQNIGRWERGDVLPNIDFCVKLANFYGISLNDLLGISDDFGIKKITPATNGESYSSDEIKLITKYRELNSYEKKLISTMLDTMTNSTEGFSEKQQKTIK